MRRPVLAVATLLGVSVLLGLGTWQVFRLQWKTELIDRVAARATAEPVPLGEVSDRARAGEGEFLAVTVSGGFATDRTAHVFGQSDGVPGWFVFQPFLPDEGQGVGPLLINRGFVPDAARAEAYPLPDAARMTGLVRYFAQPSGIAAAVRAPDVPAEGTYYEREREALAARFADALQGASVEPFYLDSTLPTALPRGGTTRLEFSNRHLGYVITWYGLAGALVAVYVAMTRKG